nr:MAG TPA: hypothetical protein [Caudoviricetes sp.]
MILVLREVLIGTTTFTVVFYLLKYRIVVY